MTNENNNHRPINAAAEPQQPSLFDLPDFDRANNDEEFDFEVKYHPNPETICGLFRWDVFPEQYDENNNRIVFTDSFV